MSCVQTAMRTTAHNYYATARLLGQQCTGDIINKRRSLRSHDKFSNQQSETDEDGNRRFRNTRLCVFHQKGVCTKGDECGYAHSEVELKVAPNLLKTRMCQDWLNGRCTTADCKFAHGRHELRFTHDYYKTKLCHFWEQGGCTKGDLCRHAHGAGELRPMPEVDDEEAFSVRVQAGLRDVRGNAVCSPGASTCTSEGQEFGDEESQQKGRLLLRFPSTEQRTEFPRCAVDTRQPVGVGSMSRAGWRGDVAPTDEADATAENEKGHSFAMRGAEHGPVGNDVQGIGFNASGESVGGQPWAVGGANCTHAERVADVYKVVLGRSALPSEVGIISESRDRTQEESRAEDARERLANNGIMEPLWQGSSTGSCDEGGEYVPGRDAFLQLAQEARELALRSAKLVQKVTVLNIAVADPTLGLSQAPRVADRVDAYARAESSCADTLALTGAASNYDYIRDFTITLPGGGHKDGASFPIDVPHPPSGSTAYSGSLTSGTSFVSAFPEIGVPSSKPADTSRGGIRSMPPPSIAPEDVFVPYPLRSGHWQKSQKESEGYLDQLAAKLSQFLTTSGGCIDDRP